MDKARQEQFNRANAATSAEESDGPFFHPDYGAKGLQRELEDRLKPDVREPATDTPSDSETPTRSWVPTVRRLLKVAAGLAIVAVFGWLPLKAIWQTGMSHPTDSVSSCSKPSNSTSPRST